MSIPRSVLQWLSAALFGLTMVGAQAAEQAELAGDWLLDQQLVDGSFPWTPAGPAFVNVQAPPGLGLLHAWRRTGRADFRTAAQATGNYLLANMDTYTSPPGFRFRSADPLFLRELSLATGDSLYADFLAAELWNRLEAGTYGPDGDWGAGELAQSVLNNRAGAGFPVLAAWDLGKVAVAAHLDGRASIRDAMLAGIVEALEAAGPGNNAFNLFGLAGAVWAGARTGQDLDPQSGLWVAAESTMDLAQILVGFQQTNGGFVRSTDDDGDPNLVSAQITAFTLIALDLLDRQGFEAIIDQALDFVLAQQDAGGQFLNTPASIPDDPGENGAVETHAETMQAYATVGLRPGRIQSLAVTGDLPSAADNDFLRIYWPVQRAMDDDVLVLEGTFNWNESNAFLSWAFGALRVTLPDGVDRVTVTADAPGDAVIQGPGNIDSLNWRAVFYSLDGRNHDWEFSNLELLDFELGIVTFLGSYDGMQIVNNRFRVPPDTPGGDTNPNTNQNVAIHLGYGANQYVAGNHIEIDGRGTSNVTPGEVTDTTILQEDVARSYGLLTNTASGQYQNLLIEDNLIQVLFAQDDEKPEKVIGIWENSSNHGGNVRVRNNRFENLSPANDPAANFQRAFRVSSHSGGGVPTEFVNNQASGANIGLEWRPSILFGSPFGSEDPILVRRNTLTGNHIGVRLDAQGSGEFRCNRIAGNADGIANVTPSRTSDADINWFGCNAGPGAFGCDDIDSSVTAFDWIVLDLAAVPDAVAGNEPSLLIADLTGTDSGQTAQALAGCDLPDGTPAEFGSVPAASLSPAVAETEDGVAESEFSAAVSATYSVTVTVDGQTIGLPIEVGDPAADLAFVFDALSSFVGTGEQLELIVLVSNLGPSDVTGAEVVVGLPSGLVNAVWTCTADPGAACPSPVSGPLDVAVDLPDGAAITYVLTADVVDPGIDEEASFSGQVNAPVGIVDPNPTNNSDQITLRFGIFADGFETTPLLTRQSNRLLR